MPCFQKSSRNAASDSFGGVAKADGTMTSSLPSALRILAMTSRWPSRRSSRRALECLSLLRRGRPRPSAPPSIHRRSPRRAGRRRRSPSDDRAAQYCRTPAAPSSSAMPLPIPLEAPVTNATRPVSGLSAAAPASSRAIKCIAAMDLWHSGCSGCGGLASELAVLSSRGRSDWRRVTRRTQAEQFVRHE